MPEPLAELAAPSNGRSRLHSLARHDLCWLKSDQKSLLRAANIRAVDRRSSPSTNDIASAHEALLVWTDAGRPLVVTRQADSIATGHCRLAFSAPRGSAPRSIVVEAPIETVGRVAPPPLLRDSIHAAPSHWQDTLHCIAHGHTALGLEARVFGSLAWQSLTGRSYLHEKSDLDLILDLSPDNWLATFTSVGKLSEEFSRWLVPMDAAPFSLDCELRLERDAAFSLAELRSTSRKVLAKSNSRSELVARSELRKLATC